MTLYDYTKTMYNYFNKEPKIKFLSWEKWYNYIDNEEDIDYESEIKKCKTLDDVVGKNGLMI